MSSVWRVLPADPRRAESLAQAARVHPLTAQLLLHRGVTGAPAASTFFHPSLQSLVDPFALPDMEQAVTRMRQATARHEPVLIFGDSDVDGLTASVIMYEALQRHGALVRARQSNRITDGYGMPATIVHALRRSATRLVILVDCGTNQAEAVRRLAAHQIDTIIIDHHVPLEDCAQPLALINPHRDPQGPFRELSSAGLALKLAHALDHTTGEDAWTASLDLAALGLLADYSPLTGEARTIVAEGLPRLVRTQRPGLARLCAQTKTTQPRPQHVLRQLVPRLNASGRLGDASAVWQLLRAQPHARVEEWLEAVAGAHQTTKQLHRQVLDDAHEQIHRLHFKDHYALVVSRAGWHQGVMGPLASQLSRRYGRPTIALAMDESEGIGSGRSIPLFNLLQALRQCERWLLQFGGHAQACGLTLRRNNLEPFQDAVNHVVRTTLGREGLLSTKQAELELPLSAVEPRWVEELEGFAPFGAGNARPTIILRGLTATARSPRTMMLSDGGATRILGKGRLPLDGQEGRYDVLASPVIEQGQVTLLVSDVKLTVEPSTPARILDRPYTPALA